MRTNNSIKNILSGISLQLITIFLGFISRKIFIDNMGVELLGINGMLTSILSMLSLVELGFGGAIYYSLYKPLAKQNINQVNATMNLYSKLYKGIGITIFILGIGLMPFLGNFVQTDISNSYVNTVYIIFLVDSVLSYFLAYRRNILSADQKSYVINNLSTVFSISTTLLQILVIVYTKNYILYLLIKIVLAFSQNLIIYFITNKQYPYLKEKVIEPLDKHVKDEIIKNAKALCIVNLSVYCVFGTDNLLLSTFTGVSIVGLYSNYSLIISTINGLIGQVFEGIKASFGNFLVEKSIEEAHSIFNVLYFINFWITTFCAISLVTLLNPFIEIWLGKEMLLPISAIYIIVFNFYSRSMTQAIELVRNSAGLYSPYPFFKYWALIEGIVNLVVSVILAGPMKLGMFGIFLGTSISTFVTVFVLPWNVYKYVFNMSSRLYYINYIIYTTSSVLLAFITYSTANIFEVNNIFITFIIKCFVCLIVPNVLIAVLFRNTSEFNYLINKLKIQHKLSKVLKIHA